MRFADVLRRRAPRADGRPRHRDDAGFPARPFRPRGHRHRLYRARRASRPDHVAEQARPHPRPREGPRRRLQRPEHPRLHDQCRDALPHRRLRLCRPALPADADVGRREPDRELGDGLQHACCERRPELVEALCGDYYRSRSGEVSPGDLPYFKQPIFSFHEGYFSATGVGAVIDKAQKLPGVPKFTPVQKEAIEVYRQTVDEIALDIDFQRGDIQFLNNFVMLHTRREYRRLAASRRASGTCCGCGSTIRPAGRSRRSSARAASAAASASRACSASRRSRRKAEARVS